MFNHPRIKQNVLDEFIKNPNPDKALFLSKDVIDYTEEELKAIEWMNKRYYCTMLMNGHWAYFRVAYETNGQTVYLTQAKFCSSLANVRILATGQNGNTRLMPIAKLWLQSPLRRQDY